MTDTRTPLLVAERDEPTRSFLVENLAADGFQAIGSQTQRETLTKLRGHGPALLVLGSLEDELQTVTLLRAIRAGEAGGDPALAVILLASSAGELALLRGFEAGCDDFVAKPFCYSELRARVRACLWRVVQGSLPRRTVVGALVIDHDARSVSNGGQRVRLSRMEFELLAYLAGAPTRVFTKAELLRDVWGFRCEPRTRTVDAHACRLRNKLAAAGAAHLVQNVRGVGYRLSVGPVVEQDRVLGSTPSPNGHAA